MKLRTFPVLLILVLGFLVRLPKITNPIADWHSWRQSDTASVTRIFLQSTIDPLRPRYFDISSAQTGIINPHGYRFVEFPTFNLFHSFIYSIFPDIGFVESGRLISIFSSLITAYVLFLLGRKFVDYNAGVVAMCLFLFLPFNVYYSRTILPEPLSIMFIFVGIWSFMKWIEIGFYKWIIVSSLFVSLAILTKPFTIFYTLALLSITYNTFGRKLMYKKELWLFLLISVIPFILWRLWMLQFPEGIPHMVWAFNGDGIRFRPSFWRWIFHERIGTLILGGWGLIPFAIGFLSLKGKNIFYGYLLGSALLFVIIFATANVRHDYYQTFLVPSISLIVATGIRVMSNSKKYNQYIAKPLIIFSLAMMFLISFYEVRGFYQVNNYSIVKAGEYVDKNTPPDSLIVAPYNKDTAFLYHTNRFGWPYVEGDIENLIQRGADYYVSVSYDNYTLQLMQTFPVIEQNGEFVVIKLN